jgi:hypothetical protein
LPLARESFARAAAAMRQWRDLTPADRERL